MQTAVPTELCYSMTDPRMPMFAKPLGVAGDEMVADKVQVLDSAHRSSEPFLGRMQSLLGKSITWH